MRKLVRGLGIVALSICGMASAEVSIQVGGIDNGKIDSIHACSGQGGKDQSPEIVIAGIPSSAKFLTIIVDDPDARPVAGKTWVHWNVFNIPVSGQSMSFAAGSKPAGKAGKSSGGSTRYEGMCPPNGKHTYRFAVFTHEQEVEVKTGFSASAKTIEDFEKINQQKITGKAMTTGDFG